MINKSKAGKFIIQKNLKILKHIFFVLADQVPENLNNVYETLFMKKQNFQLD